MDLAQFIDKYRDAIAQRVVECRTSAIMGHIWEVENPRV